MFVVRMTWSRKDVTSVYPVLTATLFSHSNSAHMFRNCGGRGGARAGMGLGFTCSGTAGGATAAEKEGEDGQSKQQGCGVTPY